MEQADVYFLIVASSVALLILVAFIISLLNYVQHKKSEFILERERSSQKYEEQLLRSQTEIAEQSLRNISWELHDNIGQLLSIANISLNRLKHEEIEFREEFEEVRELVSKCLVEIRSLSKSLNHNVLLNIGLIDALRVELDRLERMNLIETKLQVNVTPTTTYGDKEIIIFRMIQEFIANTVKHARAKNLKIALSDKSNVLSITCEDDGQGFDLNEATAHNGLLNIHSRAKLIRAEINYESSPEEGTRMKLIVPISSYEATS